MTTYWGLAVYAAFMVGVGVGITFVTTRFPTAVWAMVAAWIALAAWRTMRRRQDMP